MLSIEQLRIRLITAEMITLRLDGQMLGQMLGKKLVTACERTKHISGTMPLPC